jgi:hypothetical protein
MKLYNFFLKLTILSLIFSLGGCSLYNKIFKQEKSEKIENIQSENEKLLSKLETEFKDWEVPPPIYPSFVVEKERYSFAINIVRNTILIKYSGKIIVNTNSASNLLFSFSIHKAAQILDIGIYEIFEKTQCATMQQLQEEKNSKPLNEHSRNFIVKTKCNSANEFFNVTILYSLPASKVATYLIKNKLFYVKNIQRLLIQHKYKNHHHKTNKIFVYKPKYSRLLCGIGHNIKNKSFCYFKGGHEKKISFLVFNAKKTNLDSSFKTFRINGRYNISKLKMILQSIKKILSFYKIIFDYKEVPQISIYFHLENFSFHTGTHLFIGSDIYLDMVAGFIPSKLLKLLSSQYFICNNLSTYTIAAIEEFISDFYVSKEYNVLLPTIRHKKLDVISTYFYQSLKSPQYRKELLKQLRIFNLYFFFVREYREDIRKFTNNIRKCKIISKQYSKITKPAKISLKKLTSTKNLLVFSKSLVEQTRFNPLKN